MRSVYPRMGFIGLRRSCAARPAKASSSLFFSLRKRTRQRFSRRWATEHTQQPEGDSQRDGDHDPADNRVAPQRLPVRGADRGQVAHTCAGVDSHQLVDGIIDLFFERGDSWRFPGRASSCRSRS